MTATDVLALLPLMLVASHRRLPFMSRGGGRGVLLQQCE